LKPTKYTNHAMISKRGDSVCLTCKKSEWNLSVDHKY
jgi:hypothetical protein